MKPLNEKFNGYFQASLECTISNNKRMLKQSCAQLQNAITRSGMFSQHLCNVVNMPRWFSNVHERGNSSNTVPWPRFFRQWPQSKQSNVILQTVSIHTNGKIHDSKQLLNGTCACNHNAVQLNASKEFVQNNARQSEAQLLYNHTVIQRNASVRVMPETIQCLLAEKVIQCCQCSKSKHRSRRTILPAGT